jgi:hypothetical protein
MGFKNLNSQVVKLVARDIISNNNLKLKKMTNEKANEMNEERAIEYGNSSAFPNKDAYGFYHYGLTKREWMATQIMAGLIAEGYTSDIAADRSIKAVNDLLIAL